ncbi:MAG: ABC transporter ATP-binding protein [Spirochaetes bacterium]|nr:ABC transporter ATP-binding protein [Spirochaetota bacterium]
MKEVVNFKNVSFRYKNEEKPVVENLSFTIFEKDFISIIGPNGGGKTTLIKLMLALLTPDCGQIKLFSEDPIQTRTLVGYVPQHLNFDPLYPITAIDIVLMGRLKPKFIQFYSKSDMDISFQALRDVGIEELAKKSFPNLSGGQRQRVLIARALASNCKMLVLDEPTSNLDKESQDFLYNLLFKLKKQKTIILISHDVGFVPSISTSVFCVNRSLQIHTVDKLTDFHPVNFYNCDIRIVDHTTHKE